MVILIFQLFANLPNTIHANRLRFNFEFEIGSVNLQKAERLKYLLYVFLFYFILFYFKIFFQFTLEIEFLNCFLGK